MQATQPTRKNGLTTIEAVIYLFVVFGAYFLIKQFFTDTLLKPKAQLALEAEVDDIRKEYRKGDSNVFIRESAEQKFVAWKQRLIRERFVARNFACEVDHVFENRMWCKEDNFTYRVRYGDEDMQVLSTKVEGDRIYFCGVLGSEGSWTIGGGIENPEIPVSQAKISDKRGKACDENFGGFAAERPKTAAVEASKSNSHYLGDRLLDMVGADPQYSPAPNAIQKTIPECRFSEELSTDKGTPYVHVRQCHISDIAPNRTRATEEVHIQVVTPHCCTVALSVMQHQADFDGGLDLFSQLAGVTKKEVKCPELQPNDIPMSTVSFYVVERAGSPKLLIQEQTDGGSGGNTRETRLYFGKPVLDCTAIKRMDDDLDSIRVQINKTTT